MNKRILALLQGIGIEDILEAVVERIPAPADTIEGHDTRALIFDSAYDPYRVIPFLMSSSLPNFFLPFFCAFLYASHENQPPQPEAQWCSIAFYGADG